MPAKLNMVVNDGGITIDGKHELIDDSDTKKGGIFRRIRSRITPLWFSGYIHYTT